MADTRTLTTRTHGRYIVESPSGDAPWLVGFHGYAENAAIMFERLRAAAGSARWNLVAAEALHRFYRGRTQEVIASWMTSQDRELMIADNAAYVDAVIQAVRGDRREPLVYAGFSQGAAMAWRAACLGATAPAAVVTLGGDIPPELRVDQLARVPAALVGRNTDDAWYTSAKAGSDRQRLADAGVAVTPVTVDGGHEWTAAFSERVDAFLKRLQ